MNYWDREEAVKQIREFHSLGRDISYTGVLQECPRLLFAGVNYFKNWGVAVTSAGIDYSKVRRREVWSEEKIKEKILSLYRKGLDLSYKVMGESGYSLISAGCFYFGNWGKSIIASGLPYTKIRRKRVGCFAGELFKVGTIGYLRGV